MHLESHESADDRQYYDYNMDRNGNSLHGDEQELTPTKMKAPTVIKFLQDKEQSDYRLNESGEQLSDLLDEYAESHTQAHTEGLRERVKELEEIIVGINSCQMVGITWPDELKQKVEKIWEALK